MNSKTTKRALLGSVVAMLVCFTMLLSTTFAWFTDTAVSGSNVITAGNLYIVVEYTLDGENWKELDGANDLFKKGLWEPGHTEVVALRIKNNGTLALKYNANMNIVKETVGKTEDGKDIKLSDILTVGTLVQAVNQFGDVAVALAFENENMYKGTTAFKDSAVLKQDQDLLPGDAHYVIIKVDMDETVANEANHNGTDVPTIEFGVNVLATQYTYEKDTFGPEYDEEATYGTYVELNAGDNLLAAMASAEADMPLTIKLNGNVEWPTEGHHGENDITPASSILIDGNGYTITATGSGVTPLGDKEAPMTLKNVKIVDNSVSYNESAWELSYLEMGGRVLNCVNVDFADPISVDGDNSVFTNCTFVGHYDKNSTSTTQYGVWVANGDSTFTNCIFTGTRGMKICDQYASEVGTVIVDGCTFNGISEKPGVCIDDRDTQDMNITIKNSTFIGCKAGDQDLYIYETDNTVPTLDNNFVVDSYVTTVDGLLDSIANGDKVIVMMDDIKVTSDKTGSNGYGKTGIELNNGQTLDGNGNSIGVDAWGTWDSAINTTGGVIKNVTVNSGMRGIFVNHNSSYSDKVILENVIIDGTVYTISCDQGTNKGLDATNCTFNGWTSYAATIGNVNFFNCSFGEGQGYAYCRPYAPTAFVGCDFEAGFVMDARAAVTFENCTIGGVALTADNLSTLVISNIANASVK